MKVETDKFRILDSRCIEPQIRDLRSKIRSILCFAPLILSILVGCMDLPRMTEAHKPLKVRTGKIRWRASFEEAVEIAGSQSKPMMLVFYGVSSRRLDERVFSDPDVMKLAQNFVCLKVGADQDDLIQKYKIQEFPTIIFADTQGGEYDKFVGYISRSSFVEILKTALIPVEVEYSLQVEPSQSESASVKCVFRNVRWKSLTLSLREKHDRIFNISYESTDGQPGWEEMDKNVWLMKFNTSEMKTATIQYEVALNIMSSTSYQPEYVSYVGDDYGVLDGSVLFLAPQDFHTTGKIAIHLGLPPGWHAITPWDVEHADRLFRAESVEEVVDSVFCIGQFQFAKRHLGEHEIYIVRCGVEESSSYLDRKADEIVRIFEDYVKRFGDFPFKRYLAVFAGPTSHRHYIHGSAHSVGFAGPVNVDYTFVAHEIFHVWNGGVIKQKSDYEGWFKEGFTQYYGYLTPYRVGLYSKKRFLRHLKKDYEGYLNRYGTEDDMALTRVKEELAREEGHYQPESARLWTMYYKGALVASLMDDEIRKRTNGLGSLDDIMRYIFHEFRDRRYSSEDVLETLNTVTGQDFTQFFSDFVYGKAKLPMASDSMDETEKPAENLLY